MTAFNVVSALIPYLKSRCDCEVWSYALDKKHDEFVTIERTGGSAQIGKDAPNLAIQCWAKSEHDAYALALTLREAALMAPEHIDQICRAEVGSIYSFPDPDGAYRRYQVDVYLVTRL